MIAAGLPFDVRMISWSSWRFFHRSDGLCLI